MPALAPYTGWQAKMLLMLVPSVWYAFLFAGQPFPPTERAAAGVPFGDMFKEILRPLFIVIWLCMWLTAATELGPGQWVSNIFNDVMKSSAQAGILVLVWVNGIMYLMRQFLGGTAHRVSPIALIAIHRGRRPPPGFSSSAMADDAVCRVRRRGAPRHRHRVLVADDARASRRSGSRAAARWCWRSSARPAVSRRRSPDPSWAGSTIATARNRRALDLGDPASRCCRADLHGLI